MLKFALNFKYVYFISWFLTWLGSVEGCFCIWKHSALQWRHIWGRWWTPHIQDDPHSTLRSATAMSGGQHSFLRSHDWLEPQVYHTLKLKRASDKAVKGLPKTLVYPLKNKCNDCYFKISDECVNKIGYLRISRRSKKSWFSSRPWVDSFTHNNFVKSRT